MAGPPIDVLVRVALFADLDESGLQVLADSMWERIFLAGEVVTTEGEPADHRNDRPSVLRPQPGGFRAIVEGNPGALPLRSTFSR